MICILYHVATYVCTHVEGAEHENAYEEPVAELEQAVPATANVVDGRDPHRHRTQHRSPTHGYVHVAVFLVHLYRFRGEYSACSSQCCENVCALRSLGPIFLTVTTTFPAQVLQLRRAPRRSRPPSVSTLSPMTKLDYGVMGIHKHLYTKSWDDTTRSVVGDGKSTQLHQRVDSHEQHGRHGQISNITVSISGNNTTLLLGISTRTTVI